MTKIAIISQPEHGVLIDVSGCSGLQEILQQLTSTLSESSQFWENMNVDLNLGSIGIDSAGVDQLLSVLDEIGVTPNKIHTEHALTKAALISHGLEAPSLEPVRLLANLAQEAIPVEVQIEADANAPVQIRAKKSATTVLEQEAAVATAPRKAAVKKESDPNKMPVLYLRQTLRSGQAVSHKGHLVIVGDVNAGAEVMAEGDITVWGALRGIAHAGMAGNTKAEIRALMLAPMQIRIAQAIARSPDRAGLRKSTNKGPETASIADDKIRIVSSSPE